MIRLNSSLRLVPPEITLASAQSFGPRLGISRVTDITRLDQIGIPVYAAVRPAAMEGSLCVNAGKGVTAIEARVGAYMEAIEFAMAEPGASHVEVNMGTARDVLDGDQRPEAILDFCPIVRKGFDLSAPLACVGAHELIGDRSVLVPAELVLLPYVHQPGTGNFGSHSNGLASGNTVEEATLHALFEVIERDVRSFRAVVDHSHVVRLDSLPEVAHALVAKIEAAGLELVISTHANPFGLPFFAAVLCDPYAEGPSYLTAGYGCHLVRQIALVRALTEAVQSRLSWIHGGRDDLAEQAAEFAAVPARQTGQVATARFVAARDAADAIDFEQAPEGALDCDSVEDALDVTMARLQDAGVRHVCRIVYTQPRDPVAVVRMVVPTLEYLDRHSHRVGPRLHQLIRGRA